MIKFLNITQRVQEIIFETKKKEKIYNKDIAMALKLTPDYFAVIKRRGKIPYEALSIFAHDNNINLNWLLLGTTPKHLCKPNNDNLTK